MHNSATVHRTPMMPTALDSSRSQLCSDTSTGVVRHQITKWRRLQNVVSYRVLHHTSLNSPRNLMFRKNSIKCVKVRLRRSSIDQLNSRHCPSLASSVLFAFFLFSLLTEGVSYLRSIPLFRERLICSKFVCLEKTFLDQSEALRIDMHVDASIVSELSLWLIQ